MSSNAWIWPEPRTLVRDRQKNCSRLVPAPMRGSFGRRSAGDIDRLIDVSAAPGKAVSRSLDW